MVRHEDGVVDPHNNFIVLKDKNHRMKVDLIIQVSFLRKQYIYLLFFLLTLDDKSKLAKDAKILKCKSFWIFLLLANSRKFPCVIHIDIFIIQERFNILYKKATEKLVEEN